MTTPEGAVRLLRRMFTDAVKAVSPHGAIVRQTHVDGKSFVTPSGAIDLGAGRVVVVSIGKAALPMTAGLVEVLGDRIERGICLTKDGQTGDILDQRFEVHFASHPVPDERGVQASRRILDLVAGSGAGDIVVALISGGGSALFEAPRLPLDLSDIQVVTAQLLRAGAPIQDLNAVRSELSEVKGGGLRRAIGDAACVSLILSDVLGNDPTIIASGPTVLRKSNPRRALELLERYGLRDSTPSVVIQLLESDLVSPTRTCAPDASRDLWSIVADNTHFLQALKRAANAAGQNAQIVWQGREGEAKDLAVEFVDLCATLPSDVDCAIGGGEATVTVSGDGIGGRNTEFALAAGIELARRGMNWAIASLASDGDDGANAGAAGGYVDASSVARGLAIGRSAADALAGNDSGGFLGAIGGLFTCEATGTNVNDAYIGIRLSH